MERLFWRRVMQAVGRGRGWGSTLGMGWVLMATGSALAQAPDAARASMAHGQGKLLLTGGVSSIDGAAGGGLTPWAVTGSHADVGQWGATAYLTGASTQDYALQGRGVALSWNDRLEVSLAQQDLDTRSNLAPLNPALDGLNLKMTVVAAKLKVWGDAVLDADRWTPQVAVGVQYKKLTAGALEPVLSRGLGARLDGVDLYVSATKLFLSTGWLVNGTLRLTQANQNGLLGFGSSDHKAYRLQPEVSVAYLLARQWVVGAEYRAKPDNLRNTFAPHALQEDDWKDVFIAWAPQKNLSLTAAYVDLGRIAPALQPRRQRGGYVSGQLNY